MKCSIIFINRVFLKAQLSKHKILHKNSFLIIREIESNEYIITEYINLNIYIFNYYNVNEKLIKALLKC